MTPRPWRLEHSRACPASVASALGIPAEHGCLFAPLGRPTSLTLGGSHYFGIGTEPGSGSGVWDPHLQGDRHGWRKVEQRRSSCRDGKWEPPRKGSRGHSPHPCGSPCGQPTAVQIGCPADLCPTHHYPAPAILKKTPCPLREGSSNTGFFEPGGLLSQKLQPFVAFLSSGSLTIWAGCRPGSKP